MARRTREAAVLVPFYRDAEGEPAVVLVRRSDFGIHGGQIAFPGGKPEPGDGSFLATALREAQEEIGLAPDDVDVLEALPAVKTYTGGFLVHPFLARVRPRPWIPSEDEVVEVLEPRASELLRHDLQATGSFETFRGAVEMPYVRLGEHRLWGLTYRILQPLLPRVVAGEWEL